jgi:KUP system potassium uptake protein
MSQSSSEQHKKPALAALALGAIGVVYGDIGTSPLYTFHEVFAPDGGLLPTQENVLGVVSAIVWALLIVVTLKYVILVLRADNRGEGGALALTALAIQGVKDKPRLRRFLVLLGVFATTMFYGDSVITPAISVVGALEGLVVSNPDLADYVLPLALVILVGLFALQRWGTAFVGRFFGPIIVVWFLTLGVAGWMQVMEQPLVLKALNPFLGLQFLWDRGWALFVALGAIVLALTGAEALYADMGHFGKRPIQLAWGFVVFPSLLLNYMGQGALLLSNPKAVENPFYLLFPDSLLMPVLVLATLAAIIASQAVISGAFSVSKQAILLGFFPRMRIVYTSNAEAGQIFIPAVNRALFFGVLVAVLGFRSSGNLAGAYGIAVTFTMVITTMLTFFVIRSTWGLPRWLCIGATLFFLLIDALLFAGCALKFFDGGWFPVVLGILLFTVMTTWAYGRSLVLDSIQREGMDMVDFIAMLDTDAMAKSERTAVYLVARPQTVPQAMLHNMKHNQVLHERNVILTVMVEDVPVVTADECIQIENLGKNFWRIALKFGFTQRPDVHGVLSRFQHDELMFNMHEVSYFLSRETVVPDTGSKWFAWRKRLFSRMVKNSSGVVEFFHLPDNAVVELGTRVQI